MKLFMCMQAQYNAPIADLGTTGVPAYRVRVACNYFESTTLTTTQLLGNMVSALAVFNANTTTSTGCLDTSGATEGPTESVTTLDVSVASPEAEPEPNATPEPSSSDKFAYQVRCLPEEVTVKTAKQSGLQHTGPTSISCLQRSFSATHLVD